MSKMDDLRAMREAKWAETQKRSGAAPPRLAVRPAAPAAARPPAARTAPSETAAADTDELCGHRNISGRTCTREKGHAAKSHRYS